VGPTPCWAGRRRDGHVCASSAQNAERRPDAPLGQDASGAPGRGRWRMAECRSTFLTVTRPRAPSRPCHDRASVGFGRSGLAGAALTGEFFLGTVSRPRPRHRREVTRHGFDLVRHFFVRCRWHRGVGEAQDAGRVRGVSTHPTPGGREGLFDCATGRSAVRHLQTVTRDRVAPVPGAAEPGPLAVRGPGEASGGHQQSERFGPAGLVNPLNRSPAVNRRSSRFS